MNNNYSDKKLKKKFHNSVNRLFEDDHFLLEKDASERAISHKLAEYLQKEFPKLDVDCEYNLDIDDVKRRPSKTPFTPDIVVHIRGETNQNRIIIEVKKSNGDYNDEEAKLKETTSPKYQYYYQLGIFITLNVLKKYREEPNIQFFKNGIEIT